MSWQNPCEWKRVLATKHEVRGAIEDMLAISEVWSKMHLFNVTRLSVGLVSHHGRKLPGLVLLSGGFLLASVLPAQTLQRPAITGISHIAIFAHDYEKSRAFYGQFLGFQEPYSLQNLDGSPSMTFFKINDRQVIELFPERQAGTDRLNHISLQTEDIEALRIYLASKGIEVPPHANRARIGNLSFNISDPEGHTVEMVQYMPDGKTVLDQGQFMSDKAVSSRMTHVGLIVTNLDAEYNFYTQILGFKEFWRGSSNGKVLSWINLRVPDGDDYIEFMLAAQAPDPAHRGAAHHMCLQVPEVATSVPALEAKPYYKEYGRTIDLHTGVNRKRQANLFDPDGTRIELMEPNTIDGKPTPPSTAPPPQPSTAGALQEWHSPYALAPGTAQEHVRPFFDK